MAAAIALAHRGKNKKITEPLLAEGRIRGASFVVKAEHFKARTTLFYAHRGDKGHGAEGMTKLQQRERNENIGRKTGRRAAKTKEARELRWKRSHKPGDHCF